MLRISLAVPFGNCRQGRRLVSEFLKGTAGEAVVARPSHPTTGGIRGRIKGIRQRRESV